MKGHKAKEGASALPYYDCLGGVGGCANVVPSMYQNGYVFSHKEALMVQVEPSEVEVRSSKLRQTLLSS